MRCGEERLRLQPWRRISVVFAAGIFAEEMVEHLVGKARDLAKA